MRQWQTIAKKATASSVNCTIVFSATAPIYWLADINWWRGSCISLFFLYNLLLPHRCVGMIIARTRQNLPTNPAYAALYTASFATLLWWIWLPLDLALANGLFIQLPCLLIYGNTLHGKIVGRKTLSEAEYLFECVALKGQCPDCEAVGLKSTGAYAICKDCLAKFTTDNFYVSRVKA